MPVVVLGAESALGTAVVGALLRAGAAEVRATTTSRAAARTLVDQGVRTATLDVAVADGERLGAVLEGAHTVIHLAGHDPLATLPLVLDAADGSGVRRVITLGAGPSGAGADLDVVVVDPALPFDELVARLVAEDRRA